jgi:sRNA-binding carbon storage regulator CsrA
MLVVTRKENESIKIEPVEGVDPALTLREVFAHGPIVLKLTHVGQRRVRIVVEAPSALKVMRNEAPGFASVDEPATDDEPSQRHAGQGG